MKKCILFLMVLCSPALYASDMYVIPHVNLAYGLGDAYEPASDFTANPGFGIGGVFGYKLDDTLTFEGSVSYLTWLTDSPSGTDISMSQIPVFVGINYALDKQIGIIGGLGVAYASLEIEYSQYLKDESSDTELAFYLGAHVDIDNIIVRPQFIFINTPDDAQTYIQISAGYKFGL